MEAPVCVDVCPTEALELIDMGDYEQLLQQRRTKTAVDLERKNLPDGALVLDLVQEP
jgi:Fe-S-cluster-containing hydrogenase component 2